MAKVFQLSDGRQLSFKRHIPTSKYLMANGVITKRWCGKCKKFQDIQEFAWRKSGVALQTYCKPCHKTNPELRAQEYEAGIRRRRREGIPVRKNFADHWVVRIHGIECVKCNTCKLFYPKEHFYVGRKWTRKCKFCGLLKFRKENSGLLRRYRKIFGEGSYVLRRFENEVRSDYFQAMRQVLQMERHRRLPLKQARALWRPMYGVSVDKKAFKKAVEEKVQEVRQGWGWVNPLAVLEVPTVQVRGGLSQEQVSQTQAEPPSTVDVQSVL